MVGSLGTSIDYQRTKKKNAVPRSAANHICASAFKMMDDQPKMIFGDQQASAQNSNRTHAHVIHPSHADFVEMANFTRPPRDVINIHSYDHCPRKRPFLGHSDMSRANQKQWVPPARPKRAGFHRWRLCWNTAMRAANARRFQ